MRTGAGPNGNDYCGLDTLMIVNLTARPLHNPQLGISNDYEQDFATPLREWGFENKSDCGAVNRQFETPEGRRFLLATKRSPPDAERSAAASPARPSTSAKPAEASSFPVDSETSN
jgi:hypothetical protein